MREKIKVADILKCLDAGKQFSSDPSGGWTAEAAEALRLLAAEVVAWRTLCKRKIELSLAEDNDEEQMAIDSGERLVALAGAAVLDTRTATDARLILEDPHP